MDPGTIILLVISTISIVLIGYVVLTPILRALERPTLLFPWKRKARIDELQQIAHELLRQPLSEDDDLAVRRALNSLSIPGARQMTGPWSNSDPIVDAEQDILSVKERLERARSAKEQPAV